MLEDQYEMTEDLLSPQSGGADALPPQKLRPTKQQLKNRTKIILIILAAAIAIGAMFAYRAYAHSQYEKKLDLAEKYMDEGKTAQAKLAFEDAAQIEKRNPEPYIEMGKMYFDNGDYDQAIKYLTSANQRQETSESYYKNHIPIHYLIWHIYCLEWSLIAWWRILRRSNYRRWSSTKSSSIWTKVLREIHHR